MSRGVIAIKHPSPIQDRDDPYVGVAALVSASFVDAVVEVLENSGRGVEVAPVARCGDREPDPVAEEESKEDEYSKAEVDLKNFGVVDVRKESEDHSNCGEKPCKPPFVEHSGIGVLDLQGREEEICAALLDTRDDCNPSSPGKVLGLHYERRLNFITSSTMRSSTTEMVPILLLLVDMTRNRFPVARVSGHA